MDTAITALPELLWFMAPAYAANMAPPFARYWRGWNRPIHARLLGTHKTVVGFLLGVAAGVAATGLQALVDIPEPRVDYATWPILGLAFGFGAMAGDCLKSLAKRRLRIAPGRPWLPFDQVDFAVGSLLLVRPLAVFAWSEALLILSVTFVGDLLVNRLAFRWGVKDTPW